MSAELVHFGVADVLAPAATLRVTFTERHPFVETDGQFYRDFQNVYSQMVIPTTTQDKFWTLNANTAAPGLVTAVQDIRLFTSMTGSQVLALLDDICGMWVVVSRVELLTGHDATDATTAVGAQQRSQVAAAGQQDAAAAPSVLGAIGGGISQYLGTLRWLGIGAAFLAAAWFLTTTEKEL